MKKYKHVTAAGSWDHFHNGHKAFLNMAFDLSERVSIGVTGDQMISGKKHAESLEGFDKRKKYVATYLKKRALGEKSEIFPLQDIYGPALTDETLEAMVVTHGTRAGAEKVNEKRQEMGLGPLEIEEGANLQVVELAGWLHDIAVKGGRKNHENRGAKQAQKILSELKADPKIIKQVVACIKNHRFATGEAKTIEDKVLRDSDKIDVMGALGIARIWAFAGKYGRIFHDGKINANTKRYKRTGFSRTILEHFHEKIFLLPSLLTTKTGKRIGQKRIKFTRDFVKHYLDEWEGKDL